MNDKQKKAFNTLLQRIKRGTYSETSLNLEDFGLDANQLQDLRIALQNSKNVRQRLVSINLSKNPIRNLVLEEFENLEELKINRCELENLVISDCPKLKKLEAKINKLTAIDLTSQENLEHLNLASNCLKVIDLHHNRKLGALYVMNNRLEILDLSFFPELEEAFINVNPLRTVLIAGSPISKGLFYNGSNLDKATQSAFARRKELAKTPTDVRDLNNLMVDEVRPEPQLLTKQNLLQHFADILKIISPSMLSEILFQSVKVYGLMHGTKIRLPHEIIANICADYVGCFDLNVRSIFNQFLYELLLHRYNPEASAEGRHELMVKQSLIRDFVNSPEAEEFFAALNTRAKQRMQKSKIFIDNKASCKSDSKPESTSEPKSRNMLLSFPRQTQKFFGIQAVGNTPAKIKRQAKI